MQGQYLYEYAVIRVVPRIDREEFLNVGVIVFCKSLNFLKVLYQIDSAKLSLFTDELDLEELEENLKAFDKICNGTQGGGAFAKWSLAERFRWLTAVRSSAIQTSRPHNGFTDDLEKTIQTLFKDLVL